MQKIDLTSLQHLFQKSEDVRFQTYEFQLSKVILITCEAMIDKYLLNEVIVPRLQALCDHKEEPLNPSTITKQLHLPDLQETENLDDAVTNVFNGFVLIYIEELQLLLSSNIESKPNRSPEESSLENTIKGPRDNFIEDLAVNIALIRKRALTNSLCVEKLTIGKRSKTQVAILYFQDIADLEKLKILKQQLEAIQTDILLSGELLLERLDSHSYFIPINNTTGRPDYALQSLVSGRFIILVDGLAYAVITPTNLLMLLKTGEDNEYPMLASSVERILRLGSLIIALLLPAFWLALTTFHQEQLPFQLLATVVQSNTGLPLPSGLEMLIMIVMFELFREASLRLPSVLGGSISVVGGLIIGDAAIRAGVTSPAMIVVIAASTIATYTLVNQSLVTSVSILRIVLILTTSFLGLYGFFLSIYLVLIYLSNIRVYGVPYLNITADLSWKNISKSLFRLPPSSYKERPSMLNPQDKTKEGNE